MSIINKLLEYFFQINKNDQIYIKQGHIEIFY